MHNLALLQQRRVPSYPRYTRCLEEQIRESLPKLMVNMAAVLSNIINIAARFEKFAHITFVLVNLQYKVSPPLHPKYLGSKPRLQIPEWEILQLEK